MVDMILFPSSFFDIAKVDEDLQKEYEAVLATGLFQAALFGYEKWFQEGKLVIKNAPERRQMAIYRGWMMKPRQYEEFYYQLLEHNIKLVTEPGAYQLLHLFPNVYEQLKEDTAKIKLYPLHTRISVKELATEFNHFMVKDFVKSVKGTEFPQYFDSSITQEDFDTWMEVFYKYRGNLLTGGICIKEYLDLKKYGVCTNEYRVFYIHHEIATVSRNSGQGIYTPLPPRELMERYSNLESPFYTIDYGELADGSWKVLEAGDGGVSGLSEHQDYSHFFRAIYQCFKEETLDFKALIHTKEYDFLHTQERLGSRIMLLGLGGSYAYGTNQANSDIDLRGVTLQLPSDLIGMTHFEQYEDAATDTVIYGFNKMVKLLLECNPNTCEILGLKEEHYLIKSRLGQELIDNSGLFLSKRAIKSFGGYADAQLRRLQNAVARDTMEQDEREKHILKSVQNALDDFNRRYGGFEKGSIRLYIDKAETPDLKTEIFVDAAYNHLPLREYNTMCGILRSVVNDYDKIGKRNKKKDDNHLNKHAMHLIRLFIMAIDILEKGEIRTHRSQELGLLLKIRQGGFRQEEGGFVPEFYEILEEYEQRLEQAARLTSLPDNPDMDKVGKFVERVNRYVVTGELE